jgi:acyl-CoA thioesterase-1
MGRNHVAIQAVEPIVRNYLIQKLFVILILQFCTPVQATTLLVLGDSISAGYGINIEKGWVNLLQEKYSDNVSVINGSISGDTTGGGLNRLPMLLKTHQPNYVIIELGGNDGLRGYPLNLMRDNLYSLIELCRDHGAEPILFGMKIPPNYGKRYTEEFARVFPSVDEAADVHIIPFNLDILFSREELMQEDGIHPAEAAQPLIMDVVLKKLESILG